MRRRRNPVNNLVNHKRHKTLYRANYFLRRLPEILLPRLLWRWKARTYENSFRRLPPKAQAEIQARVDYYCKVDAPFQLPNSVSVSEFSDWKKSSYSIDIRRYLRVWRGHERFEYLFGDIRHVPEVPTFLKSRPISAGNQNSVLLKLDQLRHYYFIPDTKPWREKKDSAVWRGVCHREHRQQFVAQFFDSPLCDVGGTGGVGNPQHQKPFMSIPDQLDFKFVLSVEGHDVATNLKWIMASNSLCLMAKPKFETWYMEGTLQAGVHYVELRDDYSDLEEKIAYYLAHPSAAEAIINNAKAYWKIFYDESIESLVSHFVMKKYFDLAQVKG